LWNSFAVICRWLTQKQKRLFVTRIPAKVISVARQDGQYCVTVRMRRISYKGSFDTLAFGQNRPTVGSSRNGRLHLIYGQDPGLEEGKAFPLWIIQ
jgi:hypothetical protein